MKENSIQRTERISFLLEKGSITKEEFELLREASSEVSGNLVEKDILSISDDSCLSSNTETSSSIEYSQTTKNVGLTDSLNEKIVPSNKFDSFGGWLQFFRILFVFSISLCICSLGFFFFLILLMIMQLNTIKAESAIANLVVFVMVNGLFIFCLAYLLCKLIAIVKVIKKRDPLVPKRVRELLVLSLVMLAFNFGTDALWGFVSGYAPNSESPKIQMIKQKLKRIIRYSGKYFQSLIEKYIIYSIQIIGLIVYFQISKRVRCYYHPTFRRGDRQEEDFLVG